MIPFNRTFLAFRICAPMVRAGTVRVRVYVRAGGAVARPLPMLPALP